MSKENDRAAFSSRLPLPLAEAIDKRAARHKRARNAEVIYLLEIAVEIADRRDATAHRISVEEEQKMSDASVLRTKA